MLIRVPDCCSSCLPAGSSSTPRAAALPPTAPSALRLAVPLPSPFSSADSLSRPLPLPPFPGLARPRADAGCDSAVAPAGRAAVKLAGCVGCRSGANTSTVGPKFTVLGPSTAAWRRWHAGASSDSTASMVAAAAGWQAPLLPACAPVHVAGAGWEAALRHSRSRNDVPAAPCFSLNRILGPTAGLSSSKLLSVLAIPLAEGLPLLPTNEGHARDPAASENGLILVRSTQWRPASPLCRLTPMALPSEYRMLVTCSGGASTGSVAERGGDVGPGGVHTRESIRAGGPSGLAITRGSKACLLAPASTASLQCRAAPGGRA